MKIEELREWLLKENLARDYADYAFSLVIFLNYSCSTYSQLNKKIEEDFNIILPLGFNNPVDRFRKFIEQLFSNYYKSNNILDILDIE